MQLELGAKKAARNGSIQETFLKVYLAITMLVTKIWYKVTLISDYQTIQLILLLLNDRTYARWQNLDGPSTSQGRQNFDCESEKCL